MFLEPNSKLVMARPSMNGSGRASMVGTTGISKVCRVFGAIDLELGLGRYKKVMWGSTHIYRKFCNLVPRRSYDLKLSAKVAHWWYEQNRQLLLIYQSDIYGAKLAFPREIWRKCHFLRWCTPASPVWSCLCPGSHQIQELTLYIGGKFCHWTCFESKGPRIRQLLTPPWPTFAGFGEMVELLLAPHPLNKSKWYFL